MNFTTTSIVRILETTLWVLGLTCVGAYVAIEMQSARAQSAAISSLELQSQLGAGNKPDQSLWSPQRIALHERTLSDSGNLEPIALLVIPAVDIRVAAFEGTSDRVLNLGVGRVPGTGRIGVAGNLAIAGHRDGFFRGLKDVVIGDDISLQHAGGTDEYRVTELLVVEPDDVSVLAPTDSSSITLITCYPFYFMGSAPQRFIVRADRKAGEIDY